MIKTQNKNEKNSCKVPGKKGFIGLALASVMAFSPLLLAGCADGENGKDGQNGRDGVDGARWFSGLDYTTDSSTINAKIGDFYIDTDDYILYQKQDDGSWSVLMQNFGRPGQNGQDGQDGNDGQDGQNGQDGTSYYTFVRYAVDANGTDMSSDPTGKSYICVLTTTKQNPENSDFTNFVKFVGENGTNGQDGNDGQDGTSSYTYIAFASDANGTGFSTTFTTGLKYIGILVSNTKISELQASNFEDKWIKFVGEDGQDGVSVYVGYDGYIWSGTTKTDYKAASIELGADVIENTVGIEKMNVFKGGYVNTNLNQIALMGYYQPEINLTIYGNSLVKNVTVYANNEGSLEIGTAKVSDIVNARKTGTGFLSLTNAQTYNLVEGKNIVNVNLSVADDETIVLGGNASNVSLYYAEGVDVNDNQGLFTTIGLNASTSVYSETNNIKNKLYIQVEASYDLSTTSQAFVDMETFMSGLADQKTLSQAQAANATLYPLFYNENSEYANSQIMEITVPIMQISSLTEDQTITMYVADKSVLSSTDVSTFLESDKCKAYTLTIPASKFDGETNVNLYKFISLDISKLNITVEENEVIGFGATTDNIVSWGIISKKQTTNPELYLSYVSSNKIQNGNGGYSMLFNFAIKRGQKSTFIDRLEDITTRNNEVVVNNILKGKNISILGDSISTYQGYSNDAANTNSTIGSNNVYGNYKPSSSYDITVNDTWWMQAIKENEMNLLVNNSWSGSSTVGDLTSNEAGCGTRTENLHDDTGENAGTNPDIIAVYMGTNDLSKTVGDYSVDGFYDNLIAGDKYITPTTFSEAYAIMLDRITKKYQDADVFCFTILANSWASSSSIENVNKAIKAIAKHYGATVVDIHTETCITTENAGDYMLAAETSHIHPNALGMDLITDCFVNSLQDFYLKNVK